MASDIDLITKELCEFLKKNILTEDAVVDKDTVLADVGVDSYSTIELLLFLERKFNIIVPEGDLTRENLKTVSTLASCAHAYDR